MVQRQTKVVLKQVQRMANGVLHNDTLSLLDGSDVGGVLPCETGKGEGGHLVQWLLVEAGSSHQHAEAQIRVLPLKGMSGLKRLGILQQELMQAVVQCRVRSKMLMVAGSLPAKARVGACMSHDSGKQRGEGPLATKAERVQHFQAIVPTKLLYSTLCKDFTCVFNFFLLLPVPCNNLVHSHY